MSLDWSQTSNLQAGWVSWKKYWLISQNMQPASQHPCNHISCDRVNGSHHYWEHPSVMQCLIEKMVFLSCNPGLTLSLLMLLIWNLLAKVLRTKSHIGPGAHPVRIYEVSLNFIGVCKSVSLRQMSPQANILHEVFVSFWCSSTSCWWSHKGSWV